MPFTPSHIAAVLPFGRVNALPLAALAAGSMSPDLPYYLPALGFLNRWTHTAVGFFSVDVLLGVALWALWRSAAAPLYDLSPAAVRERWDPPGWTTSWWAVPLAVAVGAATHVGWDEFTHAGRYATTHLGLLAASYPGPLGPLAGYRYAQYASGAIGLAVIVLAALRQHRTLKPPVPQPGLARVVPWLCLAASAAGAGVRIIAGGGVRAPWDALAFAAFTGGIGAAAATLLVVCWCTAAAPRVVGWARAGSGAAG
jgi:hypothetical protein